MSVGKEQMRADIAKALGVPPADIGDDDHLADLGLDSLRLMQLTLAWGEAGLDTDFSIFADHDTLGDWWRAIEAGRNGA